MVSVSSYLIRMTFYISTERYVFCKKNIEVMTPKRNFSNILGQDMNSVVTPQCCPSRGWQLVAPEVDLRKCTLHSLPQCELGRTTLALKPRGDVTRNPKQGYQWPQNRTCECVRQKNSRCLYVQYMTTAIKTKKCIPCVRLPPFQQ